MPMSEVDGRAELAAIAAGEEVVFAWHLPRHTGSVQGRCKLWPYLYVDEVLHAVGSSISSRNDASWS